MANFILYGTAACHLCELAEQMLEQEAESGLPGGLEKVDISESEELCNRYGTTIPVLRHPDGRELNWPFDPRQLRAFLRS